VNTYGLNPSDTNTFPWLSNIAQPNFQQYKFDSLVFEFRSFSADSLSSTNTALGSVFSATNYDYSDQPLASRVEIENLDWAQSCKPSESMLIPIECEPKQTGMAGLLYVVNGNTVPVNNDPKTYYLGKFFIGTTGFQGTSINIGSLYVTYKVRLYKPFMTKPLSNASIYVSARTGANSSTNRLGNESTQTGNCDSIGVSTAGNIITLAPNRLRVGQKYRLTYYVIGSSTAGIQAGGWVLSGGLTALADMCDATNFNSQTGYGLPNASTTGTAVVSVLEFIVSDPTQTCSLAYNTGTNPASCNSLIRIEQICGLDIATIGKYIPS